MTHQTNGPDRIISLDIIRGFAVLGILLMNIQSFSMPGAAYLNPNAFGELDPINYSVWVSSHVFADQKFMSLFSMLFGIGIIIFCERVEKRNQSAAKLHYQRTTWLLLFGLIHGYFFWYGDILFSYAFCGFFVFLLRTKSINLLLLLSTLFITIGSLISIMTGLALSEMPADALSGVSESWIPPQSHIDKEINAYTGGWLSSFQYRITETFFMQTYVFLTTFIWRAGGMMLLGMALYRLGVFSHYYPSKNYLIATLVFLSIGFSLILFGLSTHHQHGFSVQYSMFIGSQFNYWGSIFVALGYLSTLLLVIKNGWLSGVTATFEKLGKTAFSNYILQTLLCTGFFYGLGFFGTFSRTEQLLAVFLVWLLQIIVTHIWLQSFQLGPLEWGWRKLTYLKLGKIER
jgi:uncharacterized protein